VLVLEDLSSTESVLLGPGVVEVGFEAELGGEFREAIVHIHFDAVVFATALVRGLEGAAIGRASEGEEFVEAISKAAECAMRAIDSAVGVAGFASVSLVLANDLLGDFHEAVEDVTEGTAELAGRSVGRSWWGVDVGADKNGKRGKRGGDE